MLTLSHKPSLSREHGQPHTNSELSVLAYVSSVAGTNAVVSAAAAAKEEAERQVSTCQAEVAELRRSLEYEAVLRSVGFQWDFSHI